jgi:hypothetical protein
MDYERFWRIKIENDDDLEVAAVLVCDQTIYRSSSLHRTRWNSFELRRLVYLILLA